MDCRRASNRKSYYRRRDGLPPARLRFDPEASSKLCPDCAATKPLDDFPRNKRKADGRHTYCKECHNARGRETLNRLYGGTRHYHLTRRYGVGAADVAAMIAAQGGMCAICLERPAEHVDHDHYNGEVRGVLCFNCNGGLGQFRDRPDILDRAITYLTDTFEVTA